LVANAEGEKVDDVSSVSAAAITTTINIAAVVAAVVVFMYSD